MLSFVKSYIRGFIEEITITFRCSLEYAHITVVNCCRIKLYATRVHHQIWILQTVLYPISNVKLNIILEAINELYNISHSNKHCSLSSVQEIFLSVNTQFVDSLIIIQRKILLQLTAHWFHSFSYNGTLGSSSSSSFWLSKSSSNRSKLKSLVSILYKLARKFISDAVGQSMNNFKFSKINRL